MHAKNFLMGIHAFFEALQHKTITTERDDYVGVYCIDNIITFGKFGRGLLEPWVGLLRSTLFSYTGFLFKLKQNVKGVTRQ